MTLQGDIDRVLRAFPPPPQETYGRRLSEETRLHAGRVMPALYQLEWWEMVASRWEDADAAAREGRPPRRLYRLTGDGARRRAELDRTPSPSSPPLPEPAPARRVDQH